MRYDKYHCEIRFTYTNKVRFTAVDLERLMERFSKEVYAYRQKFNDERKYVVIEPSLITEWCRSWSEFDQYEH